MSDSLRCPGHITELIRELERWRRNRVAYALEVRTLDRAIAYLTEYRDLCGRENLAAGVGAPPQ